MRSVRRVEVARRTREGDIDIVEVHAGDGDGLIWLSLGFVSAQDPLDVLHIACGQQKTGDAGCDALYLERTDQSLACSGEVRELRIGRQDIEFALSPAGAQALALPERIRFTFRSHPALHAQAAVQLARMAAAGQACITGTIGGSVDGH
jgi:hypothetical protein